MSGRLSGRFHRSLLRNGCWADGGTVTPVAPNCLKLVRTFAEAFAKSARSDYHRRPCQGRMRGRSATAWRTSHRRRHATGAPRRNRVAASAADLRPAAGAGASRSQRGDQWRAHERGVGRSRGQRRDGGQAGGTGARCARGRQPRGAVHRGRVGAVIGSSPRSKWSDERGAVASQPATIVSAQRSRRVLPIALAALLFAAAAVAWWLWPRDATQPAAHAPAQNVSRPSLAVLPLDNLSSGESGEYFADGMHDALIADLPGPAASRSSRAPRHCRIAIPESPWR